MCVDSFPQQVSRHHGEVSGLDRGGPERPQRPLVRLTNVKLRYGKLCFLQRSLIMGETFLKWHLGSLGKR
ncbi:hypothetical protein SASPL_156012 [Salvia splendens]|uniref:Uncharacterized protein n=1 Tax=Salvia splendens TaxID=180675 RepID=A0A8X8VXB2_SALSN|nr:hypothetical protein SASPL_156012 [Salvia splendens]